MNFFRRHDPSQPALPPKWTVRQKIKMGLWLLAAILLLIFLFENLQVVKMAYFGWSFHSPLAILFIVTLLVGMIIGWALTRYVRRQRRHWR